MKTQTLSNNDMTPRPFFGGSANPTAMRGVIRTAVMATAVFFSLGALAQEIPAGKMAMSVNNSPIEQEQTGIRTPQAGQVVVPASSLEQPGLQAHTNIVLFSLDGTKPLTMAAPSEFTTIAPPPSVAETPNSLGCIYVNSPSTSGCVPNYAQNSGGPSNAGYGAIAIVDAYDNPYAATDLATFDTYWGLAAPPHFIKILATNPSIGCGTPSADQGWALEEDLDIEYAHVFATKADILLVEASNSSYNCLIYAEQVAFNYIVNHYSSTGGQVSNSWGGGEFLGQIADDPWFAAAAYTYTMGITAFASTGDSGCGVSYPSTNPWVTAAGGTSIVRNPSTHHFSSESCWGGAGGGTSAQETYTTSFSGGNTGPWANYQYPIFGQANRAVPDMAFDADPNSGVAVYSQYYTGCTPDASQCWVVVGGTSLASPSLAGIVNRAGNKLGTGLVFPVVNNAYYSADENNLIYSQLQTQSDYKANWYDVKTGSNGCTNSATTSWDYCTGVGSPRGLRGK